LTPEDKRQQAEYNHAIEQEINNNLMEDIDVRNKSAQIESGCFMPNLWASTVITGEKILGIWMADVLKWAALKNEFCYHDTSTECWCN
jgi:hypothetical protein